MIARTMRVITVHVDDLTKEEGWAAPEGWRIVNSEYIGANRYRITVVKS